MLRAIACGCARSRVACAVQHLATFVYATSDLVDQSSRRRNTGSHIGDVRELIAQAIQQAVYRTRSLQIPRMSSKSIGTRVPPPDGLLNQGTQCMNAAEVHVAVFFSSRVHACAGFGLPVRGFWRMSSVAAVVQHNPTRRGLGGKALPNMQFQHAQGSRIHQAEDIAQADELIK